MIGVEPVDANAMALSLHHGRRVELDAVGKFADGVAVKVVGEETFRICEGLLDGVVLVSTDAICAAIKVTCNTCESDSGIRFAIPICEFDCRIRYWNPTCKSDTRIQHVVAPVSPYVLNRSVQ